MTARKANPKPRVCIVINPAKAKITRQATRTGDEVDRLYAPATQPRLAMASTDNLFERDPYTPPAQTYQRNSGHRHIASRGVQC